MANTNRISDEQTTISLPKVVRNRAKELHINISLVCRQAIKNEIKRVEKENNYRDQRYLGKFLELKPESKNCIYSSIRGLVFEHGTVPIEARYLPAVLEGMKENPDARWSVTKDGEIYAVGAS